MVARQRCEEEQDIWDRKSRCSELKGQAQAGRGLREGLLGEMGVKSTKLLKSGATSALRARKCCHYGFSQKESTLEVD
jgi:hypothetical protein